MVHQRFGGYAVADNPLPQTNYITEIRITQDNVKTLYDYSHYVC